MPVLLVGAVGDLDLAVGSQITIDTLNDPVRLEVRGILDAFPGAGTGPPTLVVPADSFFASQFNNDPRLRPGPGTPRNRPVEFQTYLWSDSAVAAAETLAGHGVYPRPHRHPRAGARDARLRRRGPGPPLPDRPRAGLRGGRGRRRGARRGEARPSVAGR